MTVRSEDSVAVSRSKRSALLRVLAATRTLAAQTTFYAAGLGAVALLGGATLPPELQFFAGAVGADILAGIITRLAQGESVPDEEIREQVEKAIAQSDIAGALQDHATQAMIGRLFRRLDLLQYAVADGQADIAERLATQAAHYQALFAELRATVERIDATTARTDETTARIDANVRALLDRVQPPTDPAQQLAGALALLAALPLEVIPEVGTALPPGSRPVFKPNPLFVGREDDLRSLAKILKGGATAAVGQVAAATGLGGIGKTQLAVEFAHRYGRFFAGGVFWLSCSDPNAVATEVVACGLLMGLPAFDALDFPSQVQRVRSVWQEPIPRLLIFDNCEDEEVLAQWRPATGGCRVLVTSRRAVWAAWLGVRSLALPVLPRVESVALLRRFRGDLAEGEPVLDAIAEELGDLPLALHLAGNFLDTYRHDVTPATYLAQLRAPGLLAHRSLVRGDRSPTEHESHVARTFALSYERLEPEDLVDGLALALLARLACFAPGEPVGRELLLLTLLSRLACFAPGEPVASELLLLTLHGDVDGPDYEASDALHRLAELGLVDGQEDGAVVMHRLVAAFVLGLPGAEKAQWAVEATLGLEAARLNKTALPALLLPWQRHLRHVTDRALWRDDVNAALLCSQFGYHLHLSGKHHTAQPYYEKALAIDLELFGENDPRTAKSFNNLGAMLAAAGNSSAALSCYETALRIWYQVPGEVHRDLARCLSNLGILLKDMNDLSGAWFYYEQALAVTEEVFGVDHIETARCHNNLGMLLYRLKDYTAALAYLEQALPIFRQELGEAHPDTARCFNNLGMVHQDMGDYSEARVYLEQALARKRQSLGETHPAVATGLNGIAGLFFDIGELVLALPLLEQAVMIAEKSLGPDHPTTGMYRQNLEILLNKMGTGTASN